MANVEISRRDFLYKVGLTGAAFLCPIVSRFTGSAETGGPQGYPEVEGYPKYHTIIPAEGLDAGGLYQIWGLEEDQVKREVNNIGQEVFTSCFPVCWAPISSITVDGSKQPVFPRQAVRIPRDVYFSRVTGGSLIGGGTGYEPEPQSLFGYNWGTWSRSWITRRRLPPGLLKEGTAILFNRENRNKVSDYRGGTRELKVVQVLPISTYTELSQGAALDLQQAPFAEQKRLLISGEVIRNGVRMYRPSILETADGSPFYDFELWESPSR